MLKGFYAFLLIIVILPLLPAQNLEIWEIQGTGNVSPYLGQVVSSDNNIVTAVGEEFFFIQTPPSRSDNNDNTSDGLLIYTGSPSGLSPGDLVNVSGEVIEFEGLTELSGFQVTYAATGTTAALPPPISLTEDFPSSQSAPVRDLEKVENMLVQFNAQVIAPSSGFNDVAGLTSSNSRPFREPGIRYPGQSNLPVWDGNPEIFYFDPDALDQPNNRFLSVGQSVNATAVFYQSDNDFIAFPTNYATSGVIFTRDLEPAADNEITLGSFNVLFLLEDNNAIDIQLPKLARYIVERMGAPDIVALQEVGDLAVLQDLNFFINQLDPNLFYTPYLIPGNNNTKINNAYLVGERIVDVNVSQLGNTETLSIGGRLHDRPPLLLEANLTTNPPTPIQVLNVHLRSLGGIEGSDANFVRTKRNEQAISVARMVQERQDENLFIVGDFNAIPYSDGYVDVINQITGNASLGAQFPVQNIVSPPLNNYAFEAEEEERYSFVFDGSAQLLDYCMSTQLNNLSVTDFAFARGNCDAALAYFSNPNLTNRSSDHDGFVVYLEPEFPLITTTNAPLEQSDWIIANPLASGSTILIPASITAASIQLVDMRGRLVAKWENSNGTVQLPEMASGMYLLQWWNGIKRGIEKVVVE
ncbi:MAG: endonuclease/exonuclease/phosphatase family protein [Bacteroidota bacterium]